MSYPLTDSSRFNYCELFIEDNGIGIEKTALEKIFDIFVQLKSDHAARGFGAGLAHCRKIVHNHGGIIAAQSKPGQGTTFSIILPVGQKQPSSPTR